MLRIDGCPRIYAGDDVFELIEAAELAEKGCWPEGRGWANEPAALVEGVRIVWNEIQRVKNALIKA